jgi:hypothetical protein
MFGFDLRQAQDGNTVDDKKSFANVSEVAGNSRIKMGVDCKTTSGKSKAYPKNR